MRIWHEQLIPKLCQKHLSGCWNEGNQVYEIITCEKIIYKGKKYRKYCNSCGAINSTDRCDNKDCPKYNHKKQQGKRLDGYFYHPAVKEFENSCWSLWTRLNMIRLEMLLRGYHPKDLPPAPIDWGVPPKPWQTLDEQIAHLRSKGCKCDV